MSRKFIATVLAASLAITSVSAVPARADGDDLVKFLAGATALVIIGNALDDNKKDRRTVTRYDDRYDGRYDRRYDDRHDRRHDDRYGRGHDDDHRRGNGHWWGHDDGRQGRDSKPKVYFDRRHDERATRDADKKWRRNVLPAQCRSSFWTPDGTQRFMDGRCLKRNYSYNQDLPKKCKIVVYDKNQKKSGYAISCLKDRGFRISQN